MPIMRGNDFDFLLLGLDEDFFPLAATATAWEIVKRKAKDAQTNGFMSWERAGGHQPEG